MRHIVGLEGTSIKKLGGARIRGGGGGEGRGREAEKNFCIIVRMAANLKF